MKCNLNRKNNNEKQIGWTDLKVIIREDGTYRIVPKTGIYQMKLENTSGDIHRMLKQDLIDGNDRFLVATYEHTDNSFCFEMFYSFKEFDKADFLALEYKLAEYIMSQNVKKPTIITLF